MQTPLFDTLIPKLSDDERRHLITIVHLDSLSGDATSRKLYKKLSEMLPKTNDNENQK